MFHHPVLFIHCKNLVIWFKAKQFLVIWNFTHSQLFFTIERGNIRSNQNIGRLNLLDKTASYHCDRSTSAALCWHMLPVMRVFLWLNMHTHVIKLCLVSTQRVLVQVIGSAKKGGQVQQLSVPRVQQVTQQVHSTVHTCTVHLLLSWHPHMQHFLC